MKDFIEIMLSVLAVYGGYTLLFHLKERLLYPKQVREQLRAAVILTGEASLPETARYARYLREEQKISHERLIILTKDDIMEESGSASAFGDVYRYTKM